MISRRALVSGFCAFSACHRAAPLKPDTQVDTAISTDTADSCGDTGATVETWVEISLSDYPSLNRTGGYAYVDISDQLVHVIVVYLPEGCYTALWRICTHGACEVDWDAELLTAVCPCHGSIFAEDGSVRLGPATQGLRVFPVVRRDNSLWLKRS